MKTKNELIAKYNRPAPRYTSYPPVPYWTRTPTESEWIGHLKASYDEKIGVDLYVHIPFCESLCYYCGCNRTITKNHAIEDGYVDLLLKEWKLYIEKLNFVPKINSLHFGGGTPTFLSAHNLEIVLKALLQNKSPDFIGSIEIDPRTVKDDHFELFKKYDITRISMGIQDFDVEVQRTINRMQSPALVKRLVDKVRALSFDSLNFDLIYGLPKQSVKTITETFEIVKELRPDLIAFYSYAHLPDKIKNQKLIKADELPSPELKRELYETGKAILESIGYVEIGMDHFALPGNSLYQAMLANKLHRNFMGYVDKKSNVLIGLGPTSISDSSLSFAQNAKDNNSYEKLVREKHLPIVNGHTHTAEDLLIQKLILDLMCQKKVTLPETEKIPFWDEIKKELSGYEADGLLKCHGPGLEVTPEGTGLVRVIAQSFDFHYRTKVTTAKFSQSV